MPLSFLLTSRLCAAMQELNIFSFWSFFLISAHTATLNPQARINQKMSPEECHDLLTDSDLGPLGINYLYLYKCQLAGYEGFTILLFLALTVFLIYLCQFLFLSFLSLFSSLCWLNSTKFNFIYFIHSGTYSWYLFLTNFRFYLWKGEFLHFFCSSSIFVLLFTFDSWIFHIKLLELLFLPWEMYSSSSSSPSLLLFVSLLTWFHSHRVHLMSFLQSHHLQVDKMH